MRMNKRMDEDVMLDVSVPDSLTSTNINDEDALKSDDRYSSAYMSAVVIANNIKFIHWNASGSKFDRLHDMSEDYYDKLSDEVDFLAELALEKGNFICNPNLCANGLEEYVLGSDDNKYEYDLGIELLKNELFCYVNILDELASNPETPRDVQSALDDMIRFWNKEINYKLSRRI